MTARSTCWIWQRFYEEPPESKTEAQCHQHGVEHGHAGWAPQYDPRWTEAQQEAYWKGYYGEEG